MRKTNMNRKTVQKTDLKMKSENNRSKRFKSPVSPLAVEQSGKFQVKIFPCKIFVDIFSEVDCLKPKEI